MLPHAQKSISAFAKFPLNANMLLAFSTSTFPISNQSTHSRVATQILMKVINNHARVLPGFFCLTLSFPLTSRNNRKKVAHSSGTFAPMQEEKRRVVLKLWTSCCLYNISSLLLLRKGRISAIIHTTHLTRHDLTTGLLLIS